MRTWILLAAMVVLGCSVGPDYEAPPTERQLPSAFGEDDPAFAAGSDDLETWWTVFDDDQLTDLIERAAEQNLDVRLAIARVNESRARLGVVRSQRSPQVGVGGDAGVSSDPFLRGATGSRYSVGLDASWELDVWGRVSREVEAASADFEATVEEQRDVAVSLYAEVAHLYMVVRTYQEQLRSAERNLAAQRDILGITRGRFDSGLSSRLDVAQAERILADTEAQVPPLRIELVRSINTIGVLLGQFPRELHAELSTDKPVPVPPQTVTVGVPANIVRQRPDIRAAERRLAAETARVGVATADLYPQFSLKGNFGFSSFSDGAMFDAGGRDFFLGPAMRWNVFDGGRVRSQIKAQDFRVDQAVLSYESTVLNALEEVESAMTAFLEQRTLVDAVGRAAQVAREELELGMGLYKEGLVGFQNILDAERAVFSLERQVATSRGEASINLVRLYKALGGGWDPDAVEADEDAEPPPGTDQQR